MSWNSVHENPVKGVIEGAASSRDFKGGFTLELCKGVNEMAMTLQEQVGAKSILAPAIHRILDKAAENEKCRGQECRSVWRLFAEDDGHDLD
jgi:3-hydroxyisobutyrate/3-hydroxypropionate dehydrogenase